MIEKAQADALARFNEYAGTRPRVARARRDRARGRLRPGRVAVPEGRARTCGARFDPRDRARCEAHDGAAPGDEDLIDVAASYALATRGEVFQVPPELMPGEAEAAAVFRY